MVAPLKGKSAKEVTAAMVNTWIKGGGGIPRSVYMDKKGIHSDALPDVLQTTRY